MLFHKLTHFPILHKEYIKRDEYAEVEHINVVLHSHLPGHQREMWGCERSVAGFVNLLSLFKAKLTRERVCVPTCRLLRGSIFMTGPTVLIGNDTSMLWLGIRGVWMGRGLVGITPKLQRKQPNKEKGTSVATSCVQLNHLHVSNSRSTPR